MIRSPWCRARSSALGSCVLSVLLLQACATPGPTALETPGQAPLELPSQWSAMLNDDEGAGPAWPADPASSIWWFPFADPLLNELILQALAANTSIHGARAAVLQAQAQRDLAAAALWPQLDASASEQRGRAGGVSTGQRLQLGLDGRWQPDVFGATRSAVQAADATALASAASLGAVQLQLSTEVGLNYVLLRAAQARLRIADDNLANQRETLEITDWREQAGLLSSQEAAQARTAAAQTAALLPSLRTSITRASHALAVLSGRPPAELLQTLAPAGALPQLNPAAQAGALNARIPAETLRQRADVRAAEYRIAAALAQLDRAEALQRWPSFSISGSLGLSAAGLSGLGRSSAVLGSLLAGIALPVLDGGAARAEVSLQQAGLLQAQQQYRAAVLLALQEVEDALVALHGDRQRVASLQQASAAAVLAANLAQQRYRSGLVDFQAVLETQRSQLASQDGLASAGADVSADQLRLIRALGGGWREPQAGQQP
ncbi:efflux transporter outer membrane subunit [Paucibacter sp. DJ2R-2]|nr:efflux transporter outer membrane subunit [Paucibacter sp. DJ4R-1]MCV2436854.1 efflux transporter outer membrane subunit [Paucibacter sp. DJ2R-2]